MSARKPTLDEWFLAYQLRKLGQRRFFNPGWLEADITAVTDAYAARGTRLSYPALVMKALALTAREVPALNRAYASTALGDRVIEFDHISVNMPVAVRDGDRTYLSALVVRDADEKSVDDIAAEIRAAQRRPMDDLTITKIVARRPNNLLWRTVLRGVHFAAYNLPGMHAFGAGGLSVSSILEHDDEPSTLRSVSYGPTALTVLLTAVRPQGGRTVLELGIGLDHTAMTGLDYRRATTTLHKVLSEPAAELLR